MWDFHLLDYLLNWQSRSDDGTFTFSAHYIREQYGRRGERAIKRLRSDNVIKIVEREQFFPGTRRKGRARRYAFTDQLSEATRRKPTRQDTSAAQQDNDYLTTRARTNLVGVGYFVPGKGGDTRHYTDFAQMPSDRRARVTIDDEPLIEIDIANCHLLGILPTLQTLKLNDDERDLITSIREGTIYDELATLTGFDRNTIIKPTLLKVLNDPAKRVRFGTYDPELGVSYYASETDECRAQFARQFAKLFPHIYKKMRELGIARSGYLLGVQYEGRIRHKFLRAFKKLYGYTPLDCHDGFYVKRSDLQRALRALKQVAGDIVVKVSERCEQTNSVYSTHSPISHLYVQRMATVIEPNPRAADFFSFHPPNPRH